MIQSPILKDFPDHFTTDRLLVRAAQVGDGALMYPAVQESRAELSPWLPWAIRDEGIEGLEMFVRRSVSAWAVRERLNLLIFRQSDNQFIGGTSLHHIEWDIPAFEIGYWLRTSASGQGYMIEAVNGLTAFARDILGARRITIRCDTLNTRSKNVAERSGYALESIARNAYRDPGGQLRDDYVFSLTWPGD